MNANIYEIKCPITKPEHIHEMLMSMSATFKGEDHQIDTYFNVDAGRLKLRQGNIENTLIRYHRTEVKAVKNSNVIFQRIDQPLVDGLKAILVDAYGIWKVVDKRRKIYFIDNVKFHIDRLEGLGDFVEIEAISTDGDFSSEVLKKQCDDYIDRLGLDRDSFLDQSYSDMII